MIRKITPFLWFNNQLEEAMEFYSSVFSNSKVGHVSRYSKAAAQTSGLPEGTAMTATFELEGQEFMGLNGGPLFTFNEAISFFVSVETQDELDHLWSTLSAHPESEQCGWLKDKFGVSWQIVPTALGELMSDPDPAKSQHVMAAMLQMKKIVIADLQKAHDEV